MTLDLVTNRELYEDVYPSESDDSSVDNDDSAESEVENETFTEFIREKDRLQDQIVRTQDEYKSAVSCLNMLDSYGKSFSESHPDNLGASIAAYQEERRKAFEISFSTDQKTKVLRKKLENLRKRIKLLSKTSKRENKSRSNEARAIEKETAYRYREGGFKASAEE